MAKYLLSIDQGTTSSRAMLFDLQGKACFTAQEEFQQFYPHDGWVEHDPLEIWQTTLAVTLKACVKAAKIGEGVLAIGITNQRETTIVWDKATGEPIYNAIVWQDRRTSKYCQNLKDKDKEALISERTGLLLDPYFSASKVNWILDNVENARERAEKGELAFGTVDSFLIWRLTNGQKHFTDATNASRTSLFNIHRQEWDQELLELFDIPESMLAEVKDSADDFGICSADILPGNIPIAGVAGDQHAALIGQACFDPGMIKSTYGTGCFVMLNTGDKPVSSKNRLLTTVAYRLEGKTTYATEGSIFVAGAGVQWLRDGIGLIDSAAETEALASSLSDNAGVYLVPAFTGLGAPHWDPEARGALFGITRDTGVANIVRAMLESICYQTADLFEAMENDGVRPNRLRVDGGMVQNKWLCGFLADILGIPVERPVETETTALGAAILAGLQVGVFESTEAVQRYWKCDEEFSVNMVSESREKLLGEWKLAVGKVIG
ncbi:MAG: glycerol kinase [Gammaproteobacteria bacterium]|jgi:glycerol kinase